jgi:antirestriction protein ArdC
LKNSGAVVRIGGDGSPRAGHWTGHKSHLDRDDGMKAKYGSAAYAMEELRADLSSAFIAAELGIPSRIDGHVSYIETWLEPLKQDKRDF